MAWLGIPVSTTQAISSAIMGVGATKRLSAVRWGSRKAYCLCMDNNHTSKCWTGSYVLLLINKIVCIVVKSILVSHILDTV